MAVSASHAALPYPIKGARYSILIPYLDADGDPTAPATPDTEISEDNAAAADAAEEASATSGMDGMALITFTGAETDCSTLAVNAKVASGPKATLATIYPRVLAVVGSGTLSAGSAGGGTLGTLLPYDVTGCFIKTTGGGTGGGGTGGADNQARKIITYNTSTGAFTVAPDWETTPSTDTTYEVLLPEGVTLGMLRTLNPTTAGRTLDVTATGEAGIDLDNASGALGTSQFDSGFLTAALLAADALTAAKFAADVWTEARTAINGGDYALDTDANGRIRIVDGTGAGELDTSSGTVLLRSATETQIDDIETSVLSILNATTIAGVVVASASKTGYRLSATGVDDILDELLSGHATAGSLGKAISDILADTNELQTDDIPGLIAALNNLSQADIRTAVGLAAANLDTQLAALPTQAEITGGAYALDTDANGRVRIVDGTGAGELDTSAGLIAGIAGTIQTLDALDTAQDTQHAATQALINALNDVSVSDILTTQMAESYAANGVAPTLAQALFAIHQKLMAHAYSGTSSTVYELDGSTPAFVGTLDDADNPTSDIRMAA